ncbi:MAG TPA: NADH-ubiquinone oxidoreductase-F iron-sulfur binding region domain-containing protein [Mycobacteriales bacterium]|nr:NADH-ubiquinone oxidoreductase-F iron-sulfur binding region domain-containing protein [Mycobacteriales bacterium]
MSPSSNRRNRGSADSSATGSFRGDMQQWFRKDGAGGPAASPASAARGEADDGRGKRSAANGRHRRAAGQVNAPLPEPTSLWGFTGRYGAGRETSPEAEAEARNTLAAGGWTPSAGIYGGPPQPTDRTPAVTGGWPEAPDEPARSGPITMTGSWRVRAAGDAAAEQRDKDWDAAVTGQHGTVDTTGSWRSATGQRALPAAESTGGWQPSAGQRALPAVESTGGWQPSAGQRALPAAESTGGWRPSAVPGSVPGSVPLSAPDWRSATGWDGAPMVDPVGSPDPAPGRRPSRRADLPAERTGGWADAGQQRALESSYGVAPPTGSWNRTGPGHLPGPPGPPGPPEPTGSWDRMGPGHPPGPPEPTGSWNRTGPGRPPGPAEPTASWTSTGQPRVLPAPGGIGAQQRDPRHPRQVPESYLPGPAAEPAGSWGNGGALPGPYPGRAPEPAGSSAQAHPATGAPVEGRPGRRAGNGSGPETTGSWRPQPSPATGSWINGGGQPALPAPRPEPGPGPGPYVGPATEPTGTRPPAGRLRPVPASGTGPTGSWSATGSWTDGGGRRALPGADDASGGQRSGAYPATGPARSGSAPSGAAAAVESTGSWRPVVYPPAAETGSRASGPGGLRGYPSSADTGTWANAPGQDGAGLPTESIGPWDAGWSRSSVADHPESTGSWGGAEQRSGRRRAPESAAEAGAAYGAAGAAAGAGAADGTWGGGRSGRRRAAEAEYGNEPARPDALASWPGAMGDRVPGSVEAGFDQDGRPIVETRQSGWASPYQSAAEPEAGLASATMPPARNGRHQSALEADPVPPAPALPPEAEPGSWQAALGLDSWQSQPLPAATETGSWRRRDVGAHAANGHASATGSSDAQSTPGAGRVSDGRSSTGSWSPAGPVTGSYETEPTPSAGRVSEGHSSTGSWRSAAQSATGSHRSRSDAGHPADPQPGSWRGANEERSAGTGSYRSRPDGAGNGHGAVSETGSWRRDRALPASGSHRSDGAGNGFPTGSSATGSWRQDLEQAATGTYPARSNGTGPQSVSATGSWRQDLEQAATGTYPARSNGTGAQSVSATGSWRQDLEQAATGTYRPPAESGRPEAGPRPGWEGAQAASGSYPRPATGYRPPAGVGPASGALAPSPRPAPDNAGPVPAGSWRRDGESGTGSYPARPDGAGSGQPVPSGLPADPAGPPTASYQARPDGTGSYRTAPASGRSAAETGSWRRDGEPSGRVGGRPALPAGRSAAPAMPAVPGAMPAVPGAMPAVPGAMPAVPGIMPAVAGPSAGTGGPAGTRAPAGTGMSARAGTMSARTGTWRRDNGQPVGGYTDSAASGRHAVVESTAAWRERSPESAAAVRQLVAGRGQADQPRAGQPARQQRALPAGALPAVPALPAPRQPAPRQPAERQPAERPLNDRRQDGTGEWPTTSGTGEWPTTEWTRAGRAPAEWRRADAPTSTSTAVVPRSRSTAVEPVRRGIPQSGALPRLLSSVRPDGRPVTLEEHVRAYGRLPVVDEDRATEVLLRLVEQSGLRGRGGAGYPVARKMQAVLDARGKPIVVVNGAAGDPASEKDAFLITRVPHLILDGAQVAAQAVGAKQVLVYVVARPRVYGAMERAVAERLRVQADAVPVRLLPAPDTYVAGESSAVAQHLSGGPAVPMFHPPHTAERGVKGRPTLVQNVETLANLALLARFGASWFRGVGTEDEPGSLVLTVRGAVPRPVVIEVPVGTTIEQAIAGAGGATEAIGAVLVGGCMGRWLPMEAVLRAPLSHAGMQAVGGVLGANVIFALPDRACGLHETARMVRYLAAETAGQCGACVNGLPAIATALTELAESRADEATVQRLYRWCGMVAGRGACNHPDGVVALVASALQVFAEEGGRHLGGWCSRPVRNVMPLPSAADQPAGLAPNRPQRAPGRPAQEPLGWDETRYGPWSTGPQLALTSGRRAR